MVFFEGGVCVSACIRVLVGGTREEGGDYLIGKAVAAILTEPQLGEERKGEGLTRPCRPTPPCSYT